MLTVNRNHNEKNIQRAFDQAANTYDKYALLQEHIGERLVSFIANAYYARIIDLGCGTGNITQRLAASCQYDTLHAVDLSPSLLQIAETRLASHKGRCFLMNFDKLEPSFKCYDLVFSNMALHWSEHFSATISSLGMRTVPNGMIAFSIPLKGTFRELGDQFHVRNMPAPHEVSTALNFAGFPYFLTRQESYSLHFQNTLDTLRSIRMIGATHVSDRKQYGLTGKSFLKNTHITSLSYEIGYFIAPRISV